MREWSIGEERLVVGEGELGVAFRGRGGFATVEADSFIEGRCAAVVEVGRGGGDPAAIDHGDVVADALDLVEHEQFGSEREGDEQPGPGLPSAREVADQRRLACAVLADQDEPTDKRRVLVSVC